MKQAVIEPEDTSNSNNNNSNSNNNAASEMNTNNETANVADDAKTANSQNEAKAEDEPISIVKANTPKQIQPKDNADVKVENVPTTTNRDILKTNYIPITETESEVPHWESAKTPNSRKVLLRKLRRKRLRYVHYNRDQSGSDEDRPYRPSDIVRGDDDVSDVDYIGKNRKKHRRRIAATILKTKNFLKDRQIISQQSELKRYRLEQYGCHLRAPLSERDIVKHKPYYEYLYRNSIRKYPLKLKSRRYPKLKTDDESPASVGGLKSDSDYLHLSPNDNDDESKLFMGYEVLKSTNMESKRSTIMSFGLSKRTVNERAKPVKKRRKKAELLNDLCNMMKYNPSALFADIDERRQRAANEGGIDQRPINVDLINQEKKVVIDVDKESDSDLSTDEDQTMLIFDKMKRDASEKFYKIRKVKVRKKPRDKQNLKLTETNRKESERKDDTTTTQNGSIEYIYNNPMVAQYMKKYNFAGRLGKHGQGINHHIQPRNVSWGAGLGAQAKSTSFQIDSQLTSREKSRRSQQQRLDVEQNNGENSRKRKSASISPRKLVTASEKIDDNNVMYMQNNPLRPLPPDNGRRALLIDFDCLFTDSFNRRVDAFMRVIQESTEISGNLERSSIIDQLFSNHGDLCDRELMHCLLSKFNVSKSFVEEFLERLDDAFEKCSALTIDQRFVKKLRNYSSFARLGIFHCGTKRRLNRELQRSGICDKLVSSAVISVLQNDHAPYVRTFRELFLRIGVSSCQSILIIPDRCNSRNFISSGVVAARVVGARSLVQIRTRPGKLPAMGRQNPFQATLALTDELLRGPRVMLNFTVRQQFKIIRKHVLAQNPKDNLWHSAVELFRPKSVNNSVVQVYIRYDQDGELNWCSSDLIHRLDERNYEKMRDNNFPALIDVSSVDGLETNRAAKRRRKALDRNNLSG